MKMTNIEQPTFNVQRATTLDRFDVERSMVDVERSSFHAAGWAYALMTTPLTTNVLGDSLVRLSKAIDKTLLQTHYSLAQKWDPREE